MQEAPQWEAESNTHPYLSLRKHSPEANKSLFIEIIRLFTLKKDFSTTLHFVTFRSK
jgi:hypothetical protein